MKSLAYLENEISILKSRENWLTIEIEGINQNIARLIVIIQEKQNAPQTQNQKQ